MPAIAPNPPSPSLPQRVLLVENSRAFVQAVAQAMQRQLVLTVWVASTLVEARAALAAQGEWCVVLTGGVLADGGNEAVVYCILGRGLPAMVVCVVGDEEPRERLLRRQIIDVE